MNTTEIVELAKRHEGNPAGLAEVLSGLVKAGRVTYDELDEAIGFQSAAYPEGYPELFDRCPDFTATDQVKRERERGELNAHAC